MAAAVLRRRVGVHEFDGGFVRSAEARALMARVDVQFDAAIDAEGYDRMRSAIDVRLKDGTELRTRADAYPGGPERPLTPDELAAKFRECAALALPEERVEPALGLVAEVDRVPRAADLAAGLEP